MRQRLVIGEDVELMVLQEVAEVVHSFLYPQEVSIEGTVRALGGLQPLAEEREETELTVDLLLEHRPTAFDEAPVERTVGA